MNMPGFTADVSLYRTSRQWQSASRMIDSSRALISPIQPARLKDESEGVNCDTCVGAQCAELHCLESGLGDGGVFDPDGGGVPCLNSHRCSACFPSGPTIFSGGRQFCIDSICWRSFGGGCRCQVFKGFVPCRLPRPVFTQG